MNNSVFEAERYIEIASRVMCVYIYILIIILCRDVPSMIVQNLAKFFKFDARTRDTFSLNLCLKYR